MAAELVPATFGIFSRPISELGQGVVRQGRGGRHQARQRRVSRAGGRGRPGVWGPCRLGPLWRPWAASPPRRNKAAAPRFCRACPRRRRRSLGRGLAAFPALLTAAGGAGEGPPLINLTLTLNLALRYGLLYKSKP